MLRVVLVLSLSALAACAESRAPFYEPSRPEEKELGRAEMPEDCEPLDDCDARLVAHYPFDGDARDVSLHGVDGLVVGPVSTTDHDERAGGALRFDGEDDYVEVETRQIGFPASFTAAVWIRFGKVDESGRKRIFGKGSAPTSSHPNWSLNLDPDNRIAFFWETATDNDRYTFSESKMEAERWVHIVGVVDVEGGESRVFIDGALDATLENGEFLPGLPPEEHPFYVGARLNEDFLERFIDADIADIRLFDAALSEDEVEALFERR